jgi:hypothetical protein
MITRGSGSETNTNHRLLNILDKLGYLPATSSVDKMIYTSIINSINELGKSCSKALLYNMCSLYGLSKRELLTNYDLFESSISKILGKMANSILINIKKEMLIHAVLNNYLPSITESDILDPSLTVNDIIERMRLDEVCKLVQNLRTASNHIIFFYKDIDIRHKILSAFFDSNKSVNAQKILLSSECECNSRWQSRISSYGGCHKLNTEIRDTLADSRNRMRYSDTSRYMVTTGVDGESSPWPSSQDNDVSILCECSIAKLTDQNINTIVKSIVASHDYVIIDEPLAMYKSRNMRRSKMR